LAQGLPSRAARRARAVQGIELWPPIDEVAAIADQHSASQEDNQEIPFPHLLNSEEEHTAHLAAESSADGVASNSRRTERNLASDEEDSLSIVTREAQHGAAEELSSLDEPRLSVTSETGQTSLTRPTAGRTRGSSPLMPALSQVHASQQPRVGRCRIGSSSGLVTQEGGLDRRRASGQHEVLGLSSSQSSRNDFLGGTNGSHGEGQLLPRLAQPSQGAPARHGVRVSASSRSIGATQSIVVPQRVDIRNRRGLPDGGVRR
jgi:hypothetical protein